MIDVDVHHIESTSNADVIAINGQSDGQRDIEMRSAKNQKPVARSASILIRSKLLILSDSESDDDSNGGLNSKTNQMSARKAKRVNKKQNPLNAKMCPQECHTNGIQMALHSSYTGKRKRSSTISEANHSSNTNLTLNGIQMDCDNDMTDTSSLSESSDDYNSDNNFDGDDEQSDFYEVIKSNKSTQRQRHHNHSHSSRAMDFAVPSTRNPFLTMGLSSATSSSYSSSLSSASMLWKRRRRMH